jgi:molybdate transport system ATP-binding protein
VAVLDVDLRVRRGTFEAHLAVHTDRPLALVGPNGCGKTSLLRALAGDGTGEGRVRVRERVLQDGPHGLPPEDRNIAFVSQFPVFFPHLSLVENVAFGRGDVRKARTALDAVGVAPDRRPEDLSGGERQRVAIARVLARDADLVLLDEPLASIDLPGRAQLRALLAEHFRGRAVVLVSHDPRDLLAWAVHVVRLEDGRVRQQGLLGDLDPTDDPLLVELLGGPMDIRGRVE